MARILVIEDEIDALDFFVFSLRQAGHEVTAALDGERALDAFHACAPDLAVVDIFMPRKDGLETIAELRRLSPGLKILIVSGGWMTPASVPGRRRYIDLTDVGIGLGADAALQKPFDPAELVSAVDALLAGRTPAAAAR